MTEFFDDLNKKSDEELIAIANGKIPYFLSAKSTTTSQDVIIEAKVILNKRQKKEMTDAKLELAILRRYVKHHDAVGTEVHKCARELSMRDVISDIIGRPIDETVVKRWHARLAPPSPYPQGVLRPCSDSTINNGPHRFHARAYYEPGRAPAWERISKLEIEVPNHTSIKKEKEQKFGILNSLKQAAIDFSLYFSGLGTDGSVGVLFLDIDNFKSLNVQFMESIVDQKVLIPFQEMLSRVCLHRGDAYRHGGEEFLILLPNHTAEEVMQFAERLRRRIETEEFSVGESSVRITVSIGIAFFPKHGVTLDDLIEKANRAEHQAKSKGKNRIEAYE
jgi:diguanylate cyclase (GGDEF)-like protein